MNLVVHMVYLHMGAAQGGKPYAGASEPNGWGMGQLARALPDITSGPEFRQIFKVQTVPKPDIFLPGRRTFNTFKNRRIEF